MRRNTLKQKKKTENIGIILRLLLVQRRQFILVMCISFLFFHSRYVDSVDNMQTLMTHYAGAIGTKAPLKVKYETRI